MVSDGRNPGNHTVITQETFSVEYIVMRANGGFGIPASDPTWYLGVAKAQMADLARVYTLSGGTQEEAPYYIATRVVSQWMRDPKGSEGNMHMVALNDAVAVNVIRAQRRVDEKGKIV